MNILILLLVKVALTTNLNKEFKRIEESGFSRNRQNRGFLPKSRRYPTNYNYDPSSKSTSTTASTAKQSIQLDRFSFQPFYGAKSSNANYREPLRHSFRPTRHNANYPRPTPKTRATRRTNTTPRKCKGVSKNEMSCYRNIYQHGLSADSSKSNEYFTVAKCTKKLRRKVDACKPTKDSASNSAGPKYYPKLEATETARATDTGDNPDMVFEKVTLGEEERKEKKVVKIGFLNVATNHWIVVNEQGVVTLQQLNDNRHRPDKRTEFYEHTTKGKKANIDFYEYAGAEKKNRSSKRNKVFLAVTNRGHFILVEHPYKKVESPSRSQKTNRVSYRWNKGPRWTGRRRKEKVRTRETRLRSRVKSGVEAKKSRKKDRNKPEHKNPSRERQRDQKLKYSLYFMSTPAQNDYIKQAFERSEKPKRSRKKQ